MLTRESLILFLSIIVCPLLTHTQVNDCGTTVKNYDEFITGSMVEPTRYPWIVKVKAKYYRHIPFLKKHNDCLGVIISSNYIATLDECIDSNRKLAAMNIASVDEELSQSGKFIANIKDPAYVSLGSLAIIKMNKPLQFTETVRPICISEDFNIKSDKLVHVNWGKENEQRVKVTTLKQYYLKKTDLTNIWIGFRIKENMVRRGSIVMEKVDNKWSLIGLVDKQDYVTKLTSYRIKEILESKKAKISSKFDSKSFVDEIDKLANQQKTAH